MNFSFHIIVTTCLFYVCINSNKLSSLITPRFAKEAKQKFSHAIFAKIHRPHFKRVTNAFHHSGFKEAAMQMFKGGSLSDKDRCDFKRLPMQIESQYNPMKRKVLSLFQYWTPYKFKVTTTSNSVVLKMDNEEHRPEMNYGIGKLHISYIFEAIHINWFTSKDIGGHTINEKTFAAEVRIVYRNKHLKTLEEAERKTDGLAVVTAVIQVVKAHSYDKWKGLLNAVREERKNSYSPQAVLTTPLADVLPRPLIFAYHYHGPMIMPYCVDTANWFIAVNPLEITSAEMDEMKSLLNLGSSYEAVPFASLDKESASYRPATNCKVKTL